jgi:hypothetical protein
LPARKAEPPKAPKAERATALWDFGNHANVHTSSLLLFIASLYNINNTLAGEEDDELPFKKGDVLTIISKEEEWWQAELNGKSGSIPVPPFVLLAIQC